MRSFRTYTKLSGIDGEEQNEGLKRIQHNFFFQSFLNFFKDGLMEKSLRHPDLD